MRILLTCFSRSWGVLELQAVELARQLQARNHSVWLACCPDSRLEQEALRLQLHALPFDVTGYVHPRLVWRMGKFISRNNIRLVHCQLSKDIATVVPAVKLSMADVPILLTRGMGSAISKKDPLHQLTYGNVSLVLAVSSVIHANVLETTPMTPERVITLPNGVDTSVFSPAHARGVEIRREFGITPSAVVVGFVGRFSSGKGLEELLRAADLVRRSRPDVRFLVIGETSYGEEEYAERIRALHASLDLKDTVVFAGYRRDIPNVMASFDILAFPSHAEAFGVVLIEAMAMELPVVASNSDGVLDIVVNEETGILVPPRDHQLLAQGLLRLVEDPALRHRMGKSGRQRVLKHFDAQKLMERLEAIYASLLEEHDAT